MSFSASTISVNALSQALVQDLLAQADTLRLQVSKSASGATIIDAGIQAEGGLLAGIKIAEICMGGLGQVQLQQQAHFAHWPYGLTVSSRQPVLACLASQYAGWSLAHEKFFCLASGPARALAQKEPLFQELGYQDQAQSTCLVIESEQVPPEEVIAKVARDTGVAAHNLTFILTPTRSLAGTVQIVARVLEVALHKLHELHFPLQHVVDGVASAPLPPPAPDFLTGMGRTNDAILFGGQVQLFVKGSDQAAAELAKQLPSSASKDYGLPFAEIFKRVNMDFYQIDPMLFSPAQVCITALESGKSFWAGKLDSDLIDLSFGYQA
jgi:methenyltetrahydromethanopterin cyclohydrolase